MGNSDIKSGIKERKNVAFRLLSYMAINKARLIIVTCLLILSSFVFVYGTRAIGPIVDNYLLPFIGQKNVDKSGLVKELAILAAMYIISAVGIYIEGRLSIKLSNDTLFTLREDLCNKILKLPIKFFDNRSHGEIMSRFGSDVEVVRMAVQRGFPEIVTATATLIFAITNMFITNVSLTFLALFSMTIMYIVVRIMGNVSRKSFRKQQILIGDANGYIEEMIEGQKVVKVFNREEIVKEDFLKITEDLEDVSRTANTFSNYIMPITVNISYFHYIITAIIGSYMVLQGNISIGKLLIFMQFARMISQPISQVAQQSNAILLAVSGAERIFEIMDILPEIDKGDITLTYVKYNINSDFVETGDKNDILSWKHLDAFENIIFNPVKGDIEFQNVVFRYSGEKDVLKGINISAKSGKKIALVGSTGAGKTTITNLLNRFYEINSGSILFDGFNIKHIKKADLRRCLSMVLQDTNLFTETIEDNIKYGRLDATDEEIIKAAELANADKFIKYQPQKYDTVLRDAGMGLSQGQRQLLSIARASVANPTILVLDEATSSIDTRTEQLIEGGMDKLMEGRTVFMIAHRLSTIRNADLILVLENGEIIEEGSHEELLVLKGRYYNLYNGMFELE